MLIIPEIQTVVILVPRTGSKSLRKAVLATYAGAMQIYRHMEADGVPQGYDRWRRVGVVRNPVDRLWSLYRFLQTMDGERNGMGKWEPAYVQAQRRSGSLPFDRWLVENETVFTSPYDSADAGRFWPTFTVRHPLPENRKSQFVYLRPDLGTEIWHFNALSRLFEALGLSDVDHHHRSDPVPPPSLSAAAADHLHRCFRWDFDITLNQKALSR